MDEPSVFATVVRRWRSPLLVAASIPLFVLVAWPFAGRTGPEVPGFTAAWCALVVATDLLTAALLIGLFRSGRGTRLLVLAVAYLWSAVVVTMAALAMPGVAGTAPQLGFGTEAGPWLWVSRHIGPPVLIALALAPWPQSWERADLDPRARRWALPLAGLVLLTGPGWLAAALSVAPGLLPDITNAATGRIEWSVALVVVAVTAVAVVVGLVGVVLRGARSGVEVWAIVVAVAWLGDVAFMTMAEDPYTVAYYGARLLGLAASVIVPASILLDMWWVHQRVMTGAQDLEAQVDRLMEAQRVRDHVSAVVSHDMRTPLAGLHGYLEVLVEDPDLDPALARRMQERSLMLTKRLTLLSEDLLAATTVENGDLVLTPADLDLSEQLAECATGFPDLDLRITCPRHVQVHADPLRLQQILTNLVRNAQKHGAEPVTVDVTPGADLVTIRVGDAGEGVPETFIPRLFERYSQGARAAGGAGIGLSVVHDLVQAHHGTIRYDLTDPAFIVTLPVGAPSQPRPEGRVLTAPTRLGRAAVES
jgi:signal transduction histidine kinase